MKNAALRKTQETSDGDDALYQEGEFDDLLLDLRKNVPLRTSSELDKIADSVVRDLPRRSEEDIESWAETLARDVYGVHD